VKSSLSIVTRPTGNPGYSSPMPRLSTTISSFIQYAFKGHPMQLKIGTITHLTTPVHINCKHSTHLLVETISPNMFIHTFSNHQPGLANMYYRVNHSYLLGYSLRIYGLTTLPMNSYNYPFCNYYPGFFNIHIQHNQHIGAHVYQISIVRSHAPHIQHHKHTTIAYINLIQALTTHRYTTPISLT